MVVDAMRELGQAAKDPEMGDYATEFLAPFDRWHRSPALFYLFQF
jgi:hypothetical protein